MQKKKKSLGIWLFQSIVQAVNAQTLPLRSHRKAPPVAGPVCLLARLLPLHIPSQTGPHARGNHMISKFL